MMGVEFLQQQSLARPEYISCEIAFVIGLSLIANNVPLLLANTQSIKDMAFRCLIGIIPSCAEG
jgi:hypothetical protein